MVEHIYRKLDNFEYIAKTYNNTSCRLHSHTYSEIIRVKKGNLDIIIDNKKYTIQPNQICYILPHTPHIMISNNSIFDVIVFSNSYIFDIEENYKDMCAKKIIFDIDNKIIDKLFENNDLYLSTSMFCYIFHLFIKNNVFTKANIQYRNFVDKALSYINDNYDKSATLNSFSSIINLNSHYTSNIFSKYFHCTFPQILNTIRIEKACEFLKNTNLSITSISNKCGYDNMRTFNRNFIQILNTTPREYRKKYNEK